MPLIHMLSLNLHNYLLRPWFSTRDSVDPRVHLAMSADILVGHISGGSGPGI